MPLKATTKCRVTGRNWLLARIREASGLREGMNWPPVSVWKNEQQSRYQPDVVIYLPQNKQVIVKDAKVSLVAYERYFNSDTGSPRAGSMTEHINSVRPAYPRPEPQRISRISAGINSLDYVLMFHPC